ncbi:hypothetical protein VNO80_26924 [Phaseolus coccineus]|uniref:Uncharacterized protein n=1 Tax=Phaseolus coccineus TaxID=3886 RepID=A0AAN9QKX8_PHACN
MLLSLFLCRLGRNSRGFCLGHSSSATTLVSSSTLPSQPVRCTRHDSVRILCQFRRGVRWDSASCTRLDFVLILVPHLFDILLYASGGMLDDHVNAARVKFYRGLEAKCSYQE